MGEGEGAFGFYFRCGWWLVGIQAAGTGIRAGGETYGR